MQKTTQEGTVSARRPASARPPTPSPREGNEGCEAARVRAAGRCEESRESVQVKFVAILGKHLQALFGFKIDDRTVVNESRLKAFGGVKAQDSVASFG